MKRQSAGSPRLDFKYKLVLIGRLTVYFNILLMMQTFRVIRIILSQQIAANRFMLQHHRQINDMRFLPPTVQWSFPQLDQFIVIRSLLL